MWLAVIVGLLLFAGMCLLCAAGTPDDEELADYRDVTK